MAQPKQKLIKFPQGQDYTLTTQALTAEISKWLNDTPNVEIQSIATIGSFDQANGIQQSAIVLYREVGH